MTWAALDWPDLTPAFPAPHPATPTPPRPDVPWDIEERVRRAEVTRGIVVPLCMLAGLLLVCAGAALFARAPHAGGRPPLVTLLLLGLGVLVAFPLPALATLLVIGPTWRQRQQHFALIRWEAERRAWRERERARYLDALPVERREPFLAALDEAARSRPVSDGAIRA